MGRGSALIRGSWWATVCFPLTWLDGLAGQGRPQNRDPGRGHSGAPLGWPYCTRRLQEAAESLPA